jgi:uncharacterized protein
MRCRAKSWPIVLGVFIAVGAFVVHAAVARVDVNDTGKFVVDTAGVFAGHPDLREKLERVLGDLERQTTDQIKVLTVPSTDGEDIFAFSQRTAERWKLGEKRKSNGALIVLDVNDHRVRIHTYYGLEGSLPDQWIGTLSRHIAQEYFRGGRYAEGLYEMTLSVVNKVTADAGVKLVDAPAPRFMPNSNNRGGWWPLAVVVAVILIVFWISWRSRRQIGAGRHGQGGAWAGPSWGPSWTSSGGSWSGGSSWGGGFGGGGGSFGGGGMSGGGGGGASW